MQVKRQDSAHAGFLDLGGWKGGFTTTKIIFISKSTFAGPGMLSRNELWDSRGSWISIRPAIPVTTYVLPIAPPRRGRARADGVKEGRRPVVHASASALPVPPGVVLPAGCGARSSFRLVSRPPWGRRVTAFLRCGRRCGASFRASWRSPRLGGSRDRDLRARSRAATGVFGCGGAAQSMPGMLTSILNVGLSTIGLPASCRLGRQPSLALDCYCRFLQKGFCRALPAWRRRRDRGGWRASRLAGQQHAGKRDGSCTSRGSKHEPPQRCRARQSGPEATSRADRPHRSRGPR